MTTAQSDFNSFRNIIHSIKKDDKRSYLIRGCNEGLTDNLTSQGFDKIIFAKEAVLQFKDKHFEKKSLKELIKRGLNKSKVIEIKRDEESITKLNELIKASRHGHEPQLKHLFITKFAVETRLFISEDNFSTA